MRKVRSTVSGVVPNLPDGLHAVDPTLREQFPLIHEHMTTSVWEEGGKRQGSSLTFFCEEGFFKVCLGNRAERLVAFFANPSFFGCLEGLERALADGSVDWRVARSGRK